jgi:hypothetical protein
VLLPHCGLADAISPDQLSNDANAARLLRRDGAREEIQTAIASRSREMCPGKDYRFSSTGL